MDLEERLPALHQLCRSAGGTSGFRGRSLSLPIQTRRTALILPFIDILYALASSNLTLD